MLYKLISGLHSSISVHIAADYLLDETTNMVSALTFILHNYRLIMCLIFKAIVFSFQWGQNLELLNDRVLSYPERVRNLYFTFLFVLRAVTKVSLHFICSIHSLTYTKPQTAELNWVRLHLINFL